MAFRCGGFSIDDSGDRREYPTPDIRIERSDVQLDDCLVGNDVLLVARLQRPDRHHGSLCGAEFARHDGLQPKHRRCRHHNRVDAGLRH